MSDGRGSIQLGLGSIQYKAKEQWFTDNISSTTRREKNWGRATSAFKVVAAISFFGGIGLAIAAEFVPSIKSELRYGAYAAAGTFGVSMLGAWQSGKKKTAAKEEKERWSGAVEGFRKSNLAQDAQNRYEEALQGIRDIPENENA